MITKKQKKPLRILKAWGWEDVIVNSPLYCAKILHFYKDSTFSLHFHIKKHETWYVSKGSFDMIFVDTSVGKMYKLFLQEGDVIEITPGEPHKLIAREESEIFEASTQHFDDDSYRIAPGDSQNPLLERQLRVNAGDMVKSVSQNNGIV